MLMSTIIFENISKWLLLKGSYEEYTLECLIDVPPASPIKFSIFFHPVHSTSWKYSTSWKCNLYVVNIFLADSNFLTKLCSSDPSSIVTF